VRRRRYMQALYYWAVNRTGSFRLGLAFQDRLTVNRLTDNIPILRPTIAIRFDSKSQIIAQLFDSIQNEKKTLFTHHYLFINPANSCKMSRNMAIEHFRTRLPYRNTACINKCAALNCLFSEYGCCSVSIQHHYTADMHRPAYWCQLYHRNR